MKYLLDCFTASSSLSQSAIFYIDSMHFTVKLSLLPLTQLIPERIRLPFQIPVSRVTEAVTLAPVKYWTEWADDSPEAKPQSPLFID